MSDPLLRVRHLRTHIPTPRGLVRAVEDVSFDLQRGQTLGLVGESGSGKSMLVRSLIGITPGRAERSGEIWLDGQDLLTLSRAQLRGYLGRRVAMVFQDPMTSLNPVVRIDRQLTEGPVRHLGMDRRRAREAALELLRQVGIPEPEHRMRQYPHQLSGGMRQRVMIAIALACEPEVLIADEATTALDVTVQKQILDLLSRLQRERNMAMIMVSHDLGVVAGRTDEVAVMYGGRLVEKAATTDLFDAPRHRYTRALLEAIPRMDHPRDTPLRTIEGAPPDLARHHTGCPFAPRCEARIDRCVTTDPPLVEEDGGHAHACLVPVGGPQPSNSVDEEVRT